MPVITGAGPRTGSSEGIGGEPRHGSLLQHRFQSKFKSMALVRMLSNVSENEHRLSFSERLLLARFKVFEAFEDPQSGKIAMGINVFVILLITFSTVTFCLETVPKFDPTFPEHSKEHKDELVALWFTIEAVVVSVFTIEYSIRLLCCPQLKPFLMSWMNAVDVLAIFPFYVELAVGETSSNLSNLRVFRTIRLMRVFRVFKMSKRSEHFAVFAETMRKSWEALLMLGFFVIIGVIVMSGILHAFEHGQWDEESGDFVLPNGEHVEIDQFRSVVSSSWWAITTLTTVGYGDAVPKTPVGMGCGPIAMLGGLLVLAMPLGIIGENLMETYRVSSLGKGGAGKKKITVQSNAHAVTVLRERMKIARSKRAEFRDTINKALSMIKTSTDEHIPKVEVAEEQYIEAVLKSLDSLEDVLTRAMKQFADGNTAKDTPTSPTNRFKRATSFKTPDRIARLKIKAHRARAAVETQGPMVSQTMSASSLPIPRNVVAPIQEEEEGRHEAAGSTSSTLPAAAQPVPSGGVKEDEEANDSSPAASNPMLKSDPGPLLLRETGKGQLPPLQSGTGSKTHNVPTSEENGKGTASADS